MRILHRNKTYFYNGKPWRVHSSFIKMNNKYYYWCYNVLEKNDFIILHFGLVSIIE